MNPNLCVVLFFLQIVGYIFCFKKNIRWMWLCLLAVTTLCFAYPIGMHFYLNRDPATDFEALAGFGELLRWLMSLTIFGFSWLVTAVTVLFKWRKMRKNTEKKDEQVPEGRLW